MSETTFNQLGARVFNMNASMLPTIGLWIRLGKVGWADASLWILIAAALFLVLAFAYWVGGE